MKSFFSLLPLLGLILSLWAVLWSVGTSAQSADAQSLLQRDLLLGVKTMKRDVRVYHYFNVLQVWDELKSEEGRHHFINRYLESAAGNFWDMTYHDTTYVNAGPGVYWANDPLISQSFGNSMVEVKIKQGSPYLSVVKPVPLQKDTLQALQVAGVITAAQGSKLFSKIDSARMGVSRDTLKLMIQPEYENFRILMQEIFNENHLQFLEYNWDSKTSGFCNVNSYSAFVFIGLKNPENDKTSLLDGDMDNLTMISDLEMPESTAQEVEMSQRVRQFREMLKVTWQMDKENKLVKNEVLLRYFTLEEINQLRQETYGCEK